ncbi:MAG: hypothetical protein E7402_01295 [Ruminococcaceae bacterium]|nr:hypothetical protein [Oscillospiraceae bacterium]
MNPFSHDTHGFDGQETDWAEMAKQFKKRKPVFWIILAAVFVFAACVVSPAYKLLMEFLQIQEIGEAYTSLFFTNLWARVATLSVGFIIIFAFFTVNILLIKKIAVTPNFHAAFLQKKWPYLLLSVVLSLFLARLAGGGLYQKLLLAMNSESFGVTDPLFQQDVGYYVFVRPLLQSLVSGGKTLLMLSLIVAAIVYFLIFVKNGQRNLREAVKEEPMAVVHLILLLVLYFVLSVLTYKFTAENILFSSFGSGIAGAGYVAAKIWKPYYKFVPYVVLAVVCFILFCLYRKKYRRALVALAVIPALFIAVTAVALATDSLVVSPNERNLESPYIAHNMEATRAAYGLDAVAETEFVPNYTMSQAEMNEDNTWLAGTRIADFGSTLTSYNQLQFLRKYYSFYDVDVVPYDIDGELNVIFLAAREMNKDNVDEAAKSYANQVFRYTHGFGVVASPVNRVTAEGQPEFLIKDIPPKSTGGMLSVTQPRIYYGELTNDYVIVGGDNKELDYSQGLEDVEFTYDGDAGIQMNLVNRSLFAAYYKDYRMLLSSNVSQDSRLLINRNVLERVQKVAPFVGFDDDPYLVVADDGTLRWILNGYTTSSYYPYAQSYGDVNYIRNSIMAVVDAYSGDVTLYVIDEEDPIARAYRRIYPKLFAEGGLPEEIASHTRVPEYLFKVQSAMYCRYHVSDAGQFYDRADVWDIAREKYQDNEIYVEPYYNIMEIDGRNEMVLMRPFVVQGKHNMVGLLVQRNDPAHYGDLILYRFPKNETVYGPMQIENRIDNDPDISREMTLWGQGGSSVIRGNLLIVPFRDALLYVEPVYITSQNNASLPELKRIVVSYGDAVAMEPTLEAALQAVFAKRQGSTGTAPQQEPEEGTEVQQPDMDAAVQELLAGYDRMKASMQAGNWQDMGQYMEELEQLIEGLRAR